MPPAKSLNGDCTRPNLTSPIRLLERPTHCSRGVVAEPAPVFSPNSRRALALNPPPRSSVICKPQRDDRELSLITPWLGTWAKSTRLYSACTRHKIEKFVP